MRYGKFLAALTVLMLAGSIAFAQVDLKAWQKKQEKAIKAAYKKKKVTELEYNKLIREQEIIKETIEKYEADDDFSAKEKNAVHGKLQRAEKRLKKYKTNGEIY